jgi:hypothetical protein
MAKSAVARNGADAAAEQVPTSNEKLEAERDRKNTFQIGDKLIAVKEAERDILNEARELKVKMSRVRAYMRMQTDEGLARERTKRDDTDLVLMWMGQPLNTQAEMFDKTNLVDRHFEAGKTAAYRHLECEPPTHLNKTQASKWRKGFEDGRDKIAAMDANPRPRAPIPDNVEPGIDFGPRAA